MKRIVILLMAVMTTVAGLAQSTNKEGAIKEMKSKTDSLSEEQKDFVFALVEEVMIVGVDSIMNEGRFMQALEMADSIQANWKLLTGREPSARMILTKANILMRLEEWRELIKTTEECFSIHKKDIDDRIVAIMYSMQGNAHRTLEEYREAIRSYEEGLYYYTKTENLGSQGDILCCMANCYGKLGKHTMASSFYEKGINKFLKYFDTTRSVLLRSDFYVKDSYKQTVLGLFAAHLFSLAVYEQDYGSRISSKEYLLMSAHCGDTAAKSEDQRIYGN